MLKVEWELDAQDDHGRGCICDSTDHDQLQRLWPGYLPQKTRKIMIMNNNDFMTEVTQTAETRMIKIMNNNKFMIKFIQDSRDNEDNDHEQ